MAGISGERSVTHRVLPNWMLTTPPPTTSSSENIMAGYSGQSSVPRIPPKWMFEVPSPTTGSPPHPASVFVTNPTTSQSLITLQPRPSPPLASTPATRPSTQASPQQLAFLPFTFSLPMYAAPSRSARPPSSPASKAASLHLWPGRQPRLIPGSTQ